VILWAHNYWAPPIGRAVEVFTKGPKLFVDVEFDRSDPFAASVEDKYRASFLNAVSVGFDPRKVVDSDGEEVPWYQGGDVTDWELLETSAVPVPMDPDALVDSGRAVATAVLRRLDRLPGAVSRRRRSAGNGEERALEILRDALDRRLVHSELEAAHRFLDGLSEARLRARVWRLLREELAAKVGGDHG
ncbi:MAG: hypothetical protein ACRDVM_03530, partial [Acidimicrobiia bacterium]